MRQLTFLFDVSTETTSDTILNAFAHDHEIGCEFLSRSRIAFLCERKVTPSLIKKIEALVDNGTLEKSVFKLRNGVHGFQYRILT